jgi:Tol biopolymer transport system component/DNA-binding winged helix-turn-helix (wHTH) protein
MKAGMSEQTTRLYEFGPFRVDAVKCVLVRDGEVVPLTPKTFETLLVLIRNRGRVLEKEELLKEVWPDTFVEENNLARNISALRKALGEGLNEHKYIVTVPGRGYRFVADVTEVDEMGEVINDQSDGAMNDWPAGSAVAAGAGSNGVEASAPVGVAGNWITNRKPSWVLASIILIVGIPIIAYVVPVVDQRLHANRLQPPRKLWQVTFDPGLESEPTWSPDGRFLAYSSDRAGNYDIWVQSVGEGKPIQVTNSPAHEWQPDWSPDGTQIVFRSESDGGGLYVVPALGGHKRKIAGFGYYPSWSPDGSRILFYSSVVRSIAEPPKMYLVTLDGSHPQEVLGGFLAEFGSFRMSWHPDGRRVSVWGRHFREGWGFWTVPVAGGTPVKSALDTEVADQIKDVGVRFTEFLWAPSGTALYFEGESQAVNNIWKVEVDAQTLGWVGGLERLTTGAGLDTEIALSSDGKKLAFSIRSQPTRLWSLPFDAATGLLAGPGTPITGAGVDALFPDLSPDGKKLVYRKQRAGREELWEMSLLGGQEKLLTAADGYSRFSPRWSRDGARLAYLRTRMINSQQAEMERSLAMLSAEGGDEQVLASPLTAGQSPYDWSPDGQWLLTSSDRRTPGRRALCLFPTSAGPQAENQVRVLASHQDHNLWQGRFSPDGRWVSFNAVKATDSATSTIWVMPTSGGEWVRITEGKYWDDKARWAPDGRTLYFVSNRTGFFNVWGVHFDPTLGKPVGAPFRVTSFDSPARMILPHVVPMDIALAADRLILPIMEVTGSIWILENVDR